MSDLSLLDLLDLLENDKPKVETKSINFKFLLNRNYHLLEFLFEFKQVCNTSTLKILLDKVEHIIRYKGDIDGGVRMLNSFRKGVKRLPTDKYGLSREKGEYIDTAHGVHWKGYPNLQKGHFRWEHGERYILTDNEIQKIDLFLKRTNLYINNYNYTDLYK